MDAAELDASLAGLRADDCTDTDPAATRVADVDVEIEIADGVCAGVIRCSAEMAPRIPRRLRAAEAPR